MKLGYAGLALSIVAFALAGLSLLMDHQVYRQHAAERDALVHLADPLAFELRVCQDLTFTTPMPADSLTLEGFYLWRDGHGPEWSTESDTLRIMGKTAVRL